MKQKKLRVYFDTCLYLDVLWSRKDRWRDLADMALAKFNKVRSGEFKLILSDWLLTELYYNEEKKKINEFINEVLEGNKPIFVKTTNEDKACAKGVNPHPDDVLHAVLANKVKADLLLTRNIDHYIGCEHLVSIELPESV